MFRFSLLFIRRKSLSKSVENDCQARIRESKLRKAEKAECPCFACTSHRDPRWYRIVKGSHRDPLSDQSKTFFQNDCKQLCQGSDDGVCVEFTTEPFCLFLICYAKNYVDSVLNESSAYDEIVFNSYCNAFFTGIKTLYRLDFAHEGYVTWWTRSPAEVCGQRIKGDSSSSP